MTVFKLQHKNGGFFAGGYRRTAKVGKLYGRKNDVSNSMPNICDDYDVVEYELVEVRRIPAADWMKEVAWRRLKKQSRRTISDFNNGGKIYTTTSDGTVLANSPSNQVIGHVVETDVYAASATFDLKELVQDGQELRAQFDADTKGMSTFYRR